MARLAVCLLVVVGLAFPLLTSCSSTPDVGTSSYAGMSGELVSNEPAPFDKVTAATKRAMTKLRLSPTLYEQDAFYALWVGEMTFGAIAQSHEIRVRVTRLTADTTEIRIRVLGRRDESRVRAVLEEIQGILGTGPKSGAAPRKAEAEAQG